MFTNVAQHPVYFNPMDFHRDVYLQHLSVLSHPTHQQIQAILDAQRRFEYLRNQPKWYMEFIPSLSEANKLFHSELFSLPFHQRQLVYLEQALVGEYSPFDGLRIVRARKNETEKSPKDSKKKNLRAKAAPVKFVQNIVKGIVKIAFAPLKINLESLHPTRITA